MPKIKLVKKKTNEMSGTGGSASATPGTGAQYAAPKAFPRVASDYNKTFGTHFAPSIPNRPSKAITYKELFEDGTYESLAGILRQLSAEEDAVKVLIKAVEMGALKPSKAISITKRTLGLKEIKESKYISSEEQEDEDFPVLNDDAIRAYLKSVIKPKYIKAVDSFMDDEEGYGESSMYFFDTPNDENPFTIPDSEVERWAKQEMSYYLFSKPDEFPGKSNVKENTDDADFDSDTTGAEGLQSSNPLEPSTLKEARYSEFKQMTKVRTPGEQLHRAIREIRRKIDEINKLVSYTEKMKTEMKSDVSEVNYLKRTKEALAKISARIQETNNKIKRLVQ